MGYTPPGEESDVSKAASHAARVLQAATEPGASARSRLTASWRRSLDHHGLDPDHRDEVQRITEAALAERRERSEAMLRVAAPRLDALFQLVGTSGCGVLLTDADGVVMDLRATDGDAGIFDAWGLTPGADWSEASEGTNGIGTCLAEVRRVIIHRDDHFHARNTAMSCMDAPIFGADGEIIGALDVSSARADQTEAFNRLIGAMVAQTARQIEADTLPRHLPRGADHRRRQRRHRRRDPARRRWRRPRRGSDKGRSAGVRPRRKGAGHAPARHRPLSTATMARGGGFERAERAAVMRALSRAGGNVSSAARALGVGRATLYRRMKRLGIDETR